MSDVVCSWEAAQILSCSADNVRRLAREGRLRPLLVTRVGRLFSRQDVEALAQQRRELQRADSHLTD
jgi:excisionase family DNA binding protein